MSESIPCRRCGRPFPKRNYASTHCLDCMNAERVGALAAIGGLKADALQRGGLAVVIAAAKPLDRDGQLAVAGVAEPEYRSKLEERYAEQLEADRLGGRVIRWRYEALKLRLADRTFYSADFFVVTAERRIELHEVKGSWDAPHQDDARVKVKVAAFQYPEFRFVGITPRDDDVGGWDREEF